MCVCVWGGVPLWKESLISNEEANEGGSQDAGRAVPCAAADGGGGGGGTSTAGAIPVHQGQGVRELQAQPLHS